MEVHVRPELFLQLLDELDEFTVLAHEGAGIQGVCVTLLLLASVVVGVQTGSFMMAVAMVLCGLFVMALVQMVGETLRGHARSLAASADADVELLQRQS